MKGDHNILHTKHFALVVMTDVKWPITDHKRQDDESTVTQASGLSLTLTNSSEMRALPIGIVSYC